MWWKTVWYWMWNIQCKRRIILWSRCKHLGNNNSSALNSKSPLSGHRLVLFCLRQQRFRITIVGCTRVVARIKIETDATRRREWSQGKRPKSWCIFCSVGLLSLDLGGGCGRWFLDLESKVASVHPSFLVWLTCKDHLSLARSFMRLYENGLDLWALI